MGSYADCRCERLPAGGEGVGGCLQDRRVTGPSPSPRNRSTWLQSDRPRLRVPAVREKTLADMPVAAPGGGGSDLLPYDLYGAFVKLSGMHVHRAVDPSFRLFYFERSCPAEPRYFHQKACENSRLHGLGPQDKVSKLLADFHQAQSADGLHANAI